MPPSCVGGVGGGARAFDERRVRAVFDMLTTAMDVEIDVVNDAELRAKYCTLIEAAARARDIFDDAATAAARQAALDSFVLQAVVGAELITDDPFLFGRAAAKLRPEIERLAEAHQQAKLEERALLGDDVAPHRARALLGALQCVAARADVTALRPHCAALLKTAAAAIGRAPQLWSADDAAMVLAWRNAVGGARSLGGAVASASASVAGTVKAAKALTASQRGNAFEALEKHWGASEASGRGSVTR